MTVFQAIALAGIAAWLGAWATLVIMRRHEEKKSEERRRLFIRLLSKKGDF